MLADLIIMVISGFDASSMPISTMLDMTTGLSLSECATQAATFNSQVDVISDVGQLIALCEPYFTTPPVNS